MTTSSATPVSVTRFWRPLALDGAEFLFASYGRYAFPRHAHAEYVVALMERGAERLRHDRGEVVVPAGEIILMNPGVVHENGAVDDAGFAYRTLYVPVPLMRRLLSGVATGGGGELRFEQPVVRDDGLAGSLSRLHAAVESGDSALRLQTLLAELVPMLFAGRASRGMGRAAARSPARGATTRVREYLDAHFAENVSLDELCGLVSLSPWHLLRSFRDHVGMPPCQYQINRRVQHVAKRLREGVSIAAAASEAGFADQSHLTRHFKRFLGITPGQFRTDSNIVQDRTA